MNGTAEWKTVIGAEFEKEYYRKLGKFVNYDPVKAIQENARRLTPIRLTMRESYQRYGTTAEQDGWKMTNPTGMQVMYVRGNV